MAREIKRICWNCAEALQQAGQRCERLVNAGGSTGICSGCGKHRVCESYEITYGRGRDNPSAPCTGEARAAEGVGPYGLRGEDKKKGEQPCKSSL